MMLSSLHSIARSALGGAARSLAALVGAGMASASPVAAQGVAADQAPVEWVRYATSATEAVTQLLQAESETAARLRAYLEGTRTAPEQPTAPLLIKIWVEKEGRISRIDHSPFAHPEPNADLRELLVGAALPGTPPADMLLPLRILIQLPPAPSAAADASTALDDANRKLEAQERVRRSATDGMGLPERGGVNRMMLENPLARPTTPRPRPPVVPKTTI